MLRRIVGSVGFVLFLGSSALSLVSSPCAKAQAAYMVSDLGTLIDNNGEVVGGASVNLKGDVAGQEILPAGARRAFVWRDGSSRDLGTLGGPSAGARGINLFDFVAGTADYADGTEHAVVWRLSPALAPGTLHASDLGTFGGNGSEGNGINNLGFVVGFAYTPTPDPTFTLEFGETAHGFVWVGHLHDLGTLGGPNSIAIGINDKGVVAGWSQVTFDPGVFGIPDLHAVIWQNGKITDIGSFGGPISLALAVNNRGEVVGQSMLPTFFPHAFVWRGASLIDLSPLPGDVASGGGGINNLGQIVGWSAGDQGQSACIWLDGQPIDLNTRISDPNWQLAVANGINDEGQIAGFGLLNGQFHGFLLTPTSEASQSATLAPSRAHLPKNVREWLTLQRSGLDRSRLARNLAF
jgi:probable HAF family extracellular repeat protein